MAQESKILVTEEGTFDLTTYNWDDNLFSDFLIKKNPRILVIELKHSIESLKHSH